MASSCVMFGGKRFHSSSSGILSRYANQVDLEKLSANHIVESLIMSGPQAYNTTIEASDIRRTLVGNTIVDHSDVHWDLHSRLVTLL